MAMTRSALDQAPNWVSHEAISGGGLSLVGIIDLDRPLLGVMDLCEEEVVVVGVLGFCDIVEEAVEAWRSFCWTFLHGKPLLMSDFRLR